MTVGIAVGAYWASLKVEQEEARLRMSHEQLEDLQRLSAALSLHQLKLLQFDDESTPAARSAFLKAGQLAESLVDRLLNLINSELESLSTGSGFEQDDDPQEAWEHTQLRDLYTLLRQLNAQMAASLSAENDEPYGKMQGPLVIAANRMYEHDLPGRIEDFITEEGQTVVNR